MKKPKEVPKVKKTSAKNAWVDHVKSVSQNKKLSYKTALQKASKGYHKLKNKESKLVQDIKINKKIDKVNN